MWFVLGLLFPLRPESLGAQKPTASTTGEIAGGEIKLTFLGNAGWEITDGRTVILVDPFISTAALCTLTDDGCTSLSLKSTDIVVPDTAAIDQRVLRADYILITHGHADHALDAPYIARKHGAVIIGHETVANIARAYDVPDSSLITVRGGEDYEFGMFALKVIPSIHTALRNKRYYNTPLAGSAPRGLRAPLQISAFVEGGNIAYLLRIAGRQILIMGSMNYIEREMEGLRPDIALVGANRNRLQIYDYTGRLIRALGRPAVVIPTHCCYAKRDEEALALEREVRAVAPRTRVVIPKRFEPIALSPRPKGGLP